MLDLRGISVSYPGRQVLDAFDLHVEAGELVGLLGPSGSGKSTVLRVIAGLIVPDAGSVTIDGADVTEVATHLRQVGMVFQDEQLFPHLDVAGNVGFGLRMRGDPPVRRRARIAELLGLVGLEGFERRPIGGLSGGERKRVALARSLAPGPKLLLLDEPLTGLDRELHDRLAVEVAAILHELATTALWVTHDRAEADAVTGRVVHLGPRDDRTPTVAP